MRGKTPVLASLFVVLAGCTGEIRVPASSPGESGEVDPAGGTGGGQAVGPTAPPRLDCSNAAPAAYTGRRLTTREYQSAVRAIFGPSVAPSSQYPGALSSPSTGYSTEAQLTEVGQASVDALLFAAEDVALAVGAVLPQLLSCATAAAGEPCANTFLDTFGRRAYRRALTSDERARLLATYRAMRADGGAFTDGVAAMTAHLLQAPQFLYVLESAAPTARALTDDELASRLALLVWGSIPDAALLDAAAAGALSTPSGLGAQLERMLAAPQADGTLARFLREWTHTRTLNAADKDRALYPQLDDALAASINESFDRFAAAQLRDGTLSSLITSPSLPADAKLSALLGVTAPASGWATVTAPRRAGVATHPALLSSLAHAQKPSFVFRGQLVLRRLLCQELGTPPANAVAVFAGLPLPPDPTARDVSDAMNASTGCAGCHRRLNPPGLSFERFDAIGAHHATDASGRSLDTAGSFALGGDTISFAGPEELAAAVAAREEARRCVGRQLFRFAFSRFESATGGDACVLQQLDDALVASGGRLSAALGALVTSNGFSTRVDP